MLTYKKIVKLLCNPPAELKEDYRYAERKYLNIGFLTQLLVRFVPTMVSLFFDINHNAKRDLLIFPLYGITVLCLYFRAYKMFTAIMIIGTVLVQISYWLSVDRGIALFTPFFFLIFSGTFIPSKTFLVAGFAFVFTVSCFIIKARLINFLRTAPQEEIVVCFEKSFTTMLVVISMSFCNLLIGRLIQENVYQKLHSLKTTVANQNHELQQMNQNLTKALEGRESFILSFSHETRNPLNGIIGNLHLLAETDLTSKKAKEYLQKANICAKILNNILLTILDSRRTGQSAIDIHLKPQTIDMSNFVREAWILCREIMRGKDITPIIEVPHGFPRCLVFDPERITQVVMNLVSNAMKFTQKGYIKVSFDWMPHFQQFHQPQPRDLKVTENMVFFTAEDTKIKKELDYEHDTYTSEWFQAGTLDEKGLLLISVEDTGCGISDADQQIIFEKFSQVNKDGESKNLGLGLGLWISKAIVNLCEGEINLASKEGIGSRFTASISTISRPFAGGVQSPANPKNSLPTQITSATHKRSQRKALVVEDFPINQTINSEMLRKCGFSHVEIAANGMEGVDTFKKKGPNYFDLVTMDLEMPLMKGKEAMALMRRWENENNLTPTKIVVISGNAIEKEMKECLDFRGEIRADEFLTKPCSYKTLAETITKLESKMDMQPINKRKTSNFAGRQNISGRKRLKILFADDDAFNIDILKSYAQKLNLEYLAAKDGEEAYSYFERHYDSIDMVFLDFNMPKMNGSEVCDRIKKKMESFQKKCKIFLLSGMNKLGDKIMMKFDGVIQKPFTFEEFENVISENIH